MKKISSLLLALVCFATYGQVDTTFVYNTSTPFGTLDIRIAKSATRYYYLQENITYSFRESSPGVKTNTYHDMTPWQSSPYSQGNLREKNGSQDYFMMNYRLLFPLGYQASYSKGYPMIVMMHGVGESGNCWGSDCAWADGSWRPSTNNPPAPTDSDHPLLNNDQSMSHGGRQHLEARNLAGSKLPDDPTVSDTAFPGFVMFPQNLNGWDTNSIQDLIRLIRLAVKKYNIDPNRIYVHGLSNGGLGTYATIKRAPWLFAAALPMSAPSDGGILAANVPPMVAHIPIWTFQGGRDGSPSPGRTEGYVRRLREAGADVRYTLYPHLAHGTWNTAYQEPDFFSWMRSKSKTRLHVFFNNTVICDATGDGVKMGFSGGFLAYQWEKDGQILSTAKGSEYVATTPGVYRARFSRISANPTSTQWEAWSQAVNVTRNTPVKPNIIPLTTTHLRGPDNAAQNTIQLKSSTKNDKYYWYKNGALINIPSNSQDDTVSIYTVTSTSSGTNGAYTLVTGTWAGCKSPASNPVNLFFNNSAPLLADANIPGSFARVSVTGSTANLSWVDRSSVETAYELWRRAPGGSFVFAGRTAPSAQSFTDRNLLPSTTYAYKIRAVNNQARSKYAPSDNVSTNLEVTTLGDNVAPTSPSNLKVTRNTTSSITLSWTASTDNNGSIKQYIVYYGNQSVNTNSPNITYTLSGLPINATYNITVKAMDNADLLSAASNQISGTTVVTGLWYGHSTGAWTDLDQITWTNPEFTGWVPNFTLAPRTQDTFFNFEFTGYVYINTGGEYFFYLNSDDGSRLFIDGVQIISFDGIHVKSTSNGGFGPKSAAIPLSAGPHDIRVIFFEDREGEFLSVGYQGADTGGARKLIPDSALKSGNPVSGGNNVPTIALTNPANNQQFVSPASISITATASDTDGSVTKVEFYNGASKIGEDLSSPYAYTWSNVADGSYTITAKATDNANGTNSSSVNIVVTGGSSTVCGGTGTISREVWTGISGSNVSNIPVNSTPQSVGELMVFEEPANVGDNFGTRVRGYVCVPQTGAYTFWISSNDHSQLSLSTDDDPANKIRIAYVAGYTSPREWTKYTTQQSAPITLVQGQRYYIEALHKEATSTDHMAVGWQLPNGIQERPIPGNRLAPFESAQAAIMTKATTSPENMMIADAEETQTEAALDIYPNPSESGLVELTISGYETIDEAEETSVEIVRMTGEIIYSEKTYCESNCGGVGLQINKDLAPGLYLVNVVRNGKRFSERLLVK